MGTLILYGVPKDSNNQEVDTMSLVFKSMCWVFIFMMLVACATPSQNLTAGLEQGVIYKKDMEVCIGGKCRQGVIVGPQGSVHDFKIKAQGNLDLFTFSTCHREETTTEHSKKKWFRKNRKVSGTYYPAPGIETGYCPVYIGGYDVNGRHSWAFIDFKTSDATLKVGLHCNGEFMANVGVSICQSRQGLIQAIEFPVEVTVDACGIQGRGKRFEFKMPRGECVVVFFSEDKLHRLTLIGYDKIIVRSK